MFYKDDPFTKPQEKTCGLSALPWRPNSTAASRNWKRRRHSSPERPWSCRLRTPRRRRTSQQHASVSVNTIVCAATLRQKCKTKLSTKLQYTDTVPTSPSADPVSPGAWQGSHWSANFKSLVWLDPEKPHSLFVCLLVGCLTSQQHASVSQGRICIDNFTCCHTEIEAADPTFHLTQSQYTDTGPTSPSTDPITPGAWQGSHWSANV